MYKYITHNAPLELTLSIKDSLIEHEIQSQYEMHSQSRAWLVQSENSKVGND